jgi:FkbM family methyltransferase
MYPWWTLVALPYSRLELPGWGRLLSALGVIVPIEDTRWHHAPRRVMRGKLHRYLMRLDLSNWSERLSFFLGRYYELDVQLLLPVLLQPGDRFVDVGANIGMISLVASRLVGPDGSVYAFEPNPQCVAALKEHLELNSIRNTTVHPCALADCAGRLTLHLTSAHTGTATLAPVSSATAAFEVPVAIGDDMLGGVPVLAVKIDVEGFEFHVLRGLARTLERHRPALITEFIEAQFRAAGTSREEIARLLYGHGYQAFGIALRREGLRQRLRLDRLDEQSVPVDNVLWVHADSVAARRLREAGIGL